MRVIMAEIEMHIHVGDVDDPIDIDIDSTGVHLDSRNACLSLTSVEARAIIDLLALYKSIQRRAGVIEAWDAQGCPGRRRSRGSCVKED